MNAILETLHARLHPIHQSAMAEFLAENDWDKLLPQNRSSLIEHWLKRAEQYTDSLLDCDENAKERAAIIEYDAYCPRWHAEDRAIGRRRCPMESPEVDQAERSEPMWCEYACQQYDCAESISTEA